MGAYKVRSGPWNASVVELWLMESSRNLLSASRQRLHLRAGPGFLGCVQRLSLLAILMHDRRQY